MSGLTKMYNIKTRMYAMLVLSAELVLLPPPPTHEGVWFSLSLSLLVFVTVSLESVSFQQFLVLQL